jgi:hypothetical protein
MIAFNHDQICYLDSLIPAIIQGQIWVLGYQMKGMDPFYLS